MIHFSVPSASIYAGDSHVIVEYEGEQCPVRAEFLLVEESTASDDDSDELIALNELYRDRCGLTEVDSATVDDIPVGVRTVLKGAGYVVCRSEDDGTDSRDNRRELA